MCGIAGFIGAKIITKPIQEMLLLQKHRGPDATAMWQDDLACLGHNRLSIIDLSDSANQPMHSKNGRFVIVFNGEIYNYKELAQKYQHQISLHTHSDTEVLLELYALKGETILDELIGMFAFAIWDKQNRSLFAARDRFGVKPFYYSSTNNQFIFASEIKTIWKGGIQKKPFEKTWAGYLTHGTYGETDETFWENIYQLPAGHLLQYDASNEWLSVKKWYQFEEKILSADGMQSSESMDAYASILTDAVKLRFRADVPVGVAVSGGLDSSLLLATILQTQPAHQQLHAYTFYSNSEAYDELPWVKKLIDHQPMFLHEPVLFSWEQIPQLAANMAAQQDEPFGGFPTLAYANIFEKAHQSGIKVLLDGQGIDEAWAGYDYYWNNSNALVQASKDAPTRANALEQSFAMASSATSFATPFSNRLQNLQYRDLFFTKLPRALRFNDRASMMHSIELREPFLDHRLVELAFSFSPEMKYQQGLPKWQLRKLAEQWMHANISLAPKRPVQTPQREWLKNELRDWAQAHIIWLATTGNPGWFDAKKMLKEWELYCTGSGDNSFYVWQWINTSLLLHYHHH